MKQQTNEVEQLSRKQILALDIATHCGYHSTHGSGTWDFTSKRGKNSPDNVGVFAETLERFILEHGIRLVVAEDVNVQDKFFVGMRKLSEFRGALRYVCHRLQLPEPHFVNVTALKKWATGDGKADKQKMIEACVNRWGLTPIDDNEADAIHIFKYFCRLYSL